MKVALHSLLRDGQETAYEEEHRTVPADLLLALQRAGIRDWTIWRSGSHLFHVVDSDDFSGAMDQLADHPVNHRWQEHMASFVDRFEENPDGEAGLGLRHVWTMTAQSLTSDGTEPRSGPGPVPHTEAVVTEEQT